ncbi:hypothetical protein GmHk_03G008014 [Glycine max]|nr:hypothetical protein GmHk_03G008014 [Glycine max]
MVEVHEKCNNNNELHLDLRSAPPYVFVQVDLLGQRLRQLLLESVMHVPSSCKVHVDSRKEKEGMVVVTASGQRKQRGNAHGGYAIDDREPVNGQR